MYVVVSKGMEYVIPSGETAAYLLHLAFYAGGHLHGVGPGQHVDVEHGGIHSVDAALSGITLPKALTGVFQGLLLFTLLACDTLIAYRIRWSAKP